MKYYFFSFLIKKEKKESTVQVFEIASVNEWKRDRCIGYVSTYIEFRIQKW